jgi:hypothetical protein
VSIDSKLTIALILGEILVLGLIGWRRIWEKLPVFSLYLLWSLVTDALGLYFQINHATVYQKFTFFEVQSIIDAVLIFAVLVELSWSVLRPVRASLPKKTILFLAILVAVAGLVVWPFAGINIEHITPQAKLFMHLNQTMVLLRIVCFLIMAGLSQLLSIGWRDRELQIATGFGVYSIVSMVVSMMDSHQVDVNKIHAYHLAITISYLGTLAYWVLSFAAKEYQRKEFSPQMQQFLVYMGGAARTGSIVLSDIPPDRLRKREK